MTEKLKEIINREITKLPKEAQNAIGSLDWTNITEKIGKQNLLTESETNTLITETLIILAWLEEVNSFAINIEDGAGVSKEEAEKIAREISLEVLTPIYETLVRDIKNKVTEENKDWRQNFNFIISGGDYTAFLENPEEEKI